MSARAAGGGISVVVTVLDDRDELPELLDALGGQTRPPDEVVVVDGGSTDGTVALLEECRDSGALPLRLLHAPGTGISAGRNLAIRSARHERIACTDAGCRPVREWLEALDGGLDEHGFVAGVYRVQGRTPFERCLAVALYPSPDEIGDRRPLVRLSHALFGRGFEARLATGRSMAFTRATWAAVGGFPQDMRTGEDTWFSSAVVGSGVPATLLPAAEVSWRPRTTWRANVRMYVSYARGDIRRGSRRRHAARALAWTAAPTLALRAAPAVRLIVVAGAAAYLGLPLARARESGLRKRDWWRLPFVVAMKDLSQCAGALQGLGDVIRGTPQPPPGDRRRGAGLATPDPVRDG